MTMCLCLALAIRHVNRIFMRRITLSSAICLAVPCFSTLSYKGHDFRGGGGKGTEHTTCVSLQVLSETFLILKIIHRHTIINLHSSSCKAPGIFV
jgi:hypothetical protein